jgi:hypothetical protein
VFSRKKKPYVLDSKALVLETLSILKGALIAKRLPLRLALITCVILVNASLRAEYVFHNFVLWGQLKEVEKIVFYTGRKNGFFQGRGTARGLELAECLENITTSQAIAMIDKTYKDHPEKWSHPIGEQVIAALTVNGGPCQGLDPFFGLTRWVASHDLFMYHYWEQTEVLMMKLYWAPRTRSLRVLWVIDIFSTALI